MLFSSAYPVLSNTITTEEWWEQLGQRTLHKWDKLLSTSSSKTTCSQYLMNTKNEPDTLLQAHR